VVAGIQSLPRRSTGSRHIPPGSPRFRTCEKQKSFSTSSWVLSSAWLTQHVAIRPRTGRRSQDSNTWRSPSSISSSPLTRISWPRPCATSAVPMRGARPFSLVHGVFSFANTSEDCRRKARSRMPTAHRETASRTLEHHRVAGTNFRMAGEALAGERFFVGSAPPLSRHHSDCFPASTSPPRGR